MDVYLNQQKIRLQAKHLIGHGGEATIYDLGKGHALKLFKPANHPDYSHSDQLQQAVAFRLKEHQSKLRQFPSGLPERVIQPLALAYDRRGQTILGYQMTRLTQVNPLFSYGDRGFRQRGISALEMTHILLDLYQTVQQLHEQGVILGDFNDLNILVKNQTAYVIDADSFQFGPFYCRVFTERFLDPLLADPQGDRLTLKVVYTPESDWYAFAVMVMQCLLFVHPYGGVYRPAPGTAKIPQHGRPLQRITIFDPQVRYPKPALPLKVLPDELLDYFYQVFAGDRRGVFPKVLLKSLAWTTCIHCGLEHSRTRCPQCCHGRSLLVKTLGTVQIRQLFQTSGTILRATVQAGTLRWLAYENQKFYREDGSLVLEGPLDPCLQVQIHGRSTLLGKDGQVILLSPEQAPRRLGVDPSYGARRATLGFAANAEYYYWLQQGQLYRSGSLGPTYLGEGLMQQTSFWVGDQFGLGCYQADTLTTLFVCDRQRPGLNDRIRCPPWPGPYLELTCFFSLNLAWFLGTSQVHGQIVHHGLVVTPQGDIEATIPPKNAPWLTHLESLCPIGRTLFMATDDGILRLEIDQGQLTPTRLFSETEPFVDSQCQLLPAPQGFYMVRSHSIDHIQLTQ